MTARKNKKAAEPGFHGDLVAPYSERKGLWLGRESHRTQAGRPPWRPSVRPAAGYARRCRSRRATRKTRARMQSGLERFVLSRSREPTDEYSWLGRSVFKSRRVMEFVDTLVATPTLFSRSWIESLDAQNCSHVESSVMSRASAPPAGVASPLNRSDTRTAGFALSNFLRHERSDQSPLHVAGAICTPVVYWFCDATLKRSVRQRTDPSLRQQYRSILRPR